MTRRITRVNMGKRSSMERRIRSQRRLKSVPVLYNSLKKKYLRYTQSKNRSLRQPKSALISSLEFASMAKIAGSSMIKRSRTILLL